MYLLAVVELPRLGGVFIFSKFQFPQVGVYIWGLTHFNLGNLRRRRGEQRGSPVGGGEDKNPVLERLIPPLDPVLEHVISMLLYFLTVKNDLIRNQSQSKSK